MGSRREFLKLGAGAAVAGALFRDALAQAAAIPADVRTGTLMDVDHIVVLMQENRSFDHYFGVLRGVNGFADPHPMPLASGEPIWRQPDGKGGVVAPFRFDSRDTSFPIMKSLKHDRASGWAAVNGGRHDRWVKAKGPLTMGYLTRADIPYHFALADAFTVCDAYFSSLLGPTCPNRLFMMTGGIDPEGRGGGPVVDNDNITQVPDGHRIYDRTWVTYPERLQAAGVRWQTYRQGDNPLSDDDSDGGMNLLPAFRAFREAPFGSPLHARGIAPRRLDQLKRDVQAGELAQVSWIFPPRNFCEHPRFPPAYGVEFIARVLEALTSNPKVWSRTAFILTYDENDGFFDHVPPPMPPHGGRGASTVRTDDEIYPGDGLPYGLGMRVPTLVISPWSRGGFVCSEVFDHTSLIRFMEARFGVREPNISQWRRTLCGDLTSAFDFTSANPRVEDPLRMADALSALPDQAAFEAFKTRYKTKPKPVAPAAASPPRVETGDRPKRPSPYHLSAALRRAGGEVTLELVNDSAVGAAFQVIDLTAPQEAAAWFTVGPQARLIQAVPPRRGRLALRIAGPAGFVRTLELEL